MVPPDLKEFLRVYEILKPYLTDEERQGLADIVDMVRQETLIDDLSASLAFAKLSLLN